MDSFDYSSLSVCSYYYERMPVVQLNSYRCSCGYYWSAVILGLPNELVSNDFAHGTAYLLMLVERTLQHRLVSDEHSFPTMDDHFSALALFRSDIVRMRDAFFDLVLSPFAYLGDEIHVPVLNIDGALEIPPNFADIILHYTIFVYFAYPFPLDESRVDSNFVSLVVRVALANMCAALVARSMQHANQFDAEEWAVLVKQTVLFVMMLSIAKHVVVVQGTL